MRLTFLMNIPKKKVGI